MNRTILKTSIGYNGNLFLISRGVAQWLRKKPTRNHRIPIRYKRFKVGLDPDQILAHYSRDDIDHLDTIEGRTYRDAQNTIGKRDYTLKNLRQEDLESNAAFQDEMDRQRAIIARIDKIRVVIDSIPGKDKVLMMNKGLSTPYDCSCHIHELVSNRSVLAELLPMDSSSEDSTVSHEGTTPSSSTSKETTLVSDLTKTGSSELDHHKGQCHKTGSKFWDMHRPLTEDCRIRFRHFLEKDVSFVNKAYWRSCSFVLGMAIRMAFKHDIQPILHSWPKPDIKSGSFVYDVALNLSDKWEPSEQELRAFTKILWNIKKSDLPFERLEVNQDVAKVIFKKNPLKLSQIESISQQNNGKVTIYRCGGLLDMSVGPMISNTNQIGRITLASVHPFESQSDEYSGVFYRFQGISIPQQLPLSSYLYQNLLIGRAKTLNKTAL